jgi:hypothetical protein
MGRMVDEPELSSSAHATAEEFSSAVVINSDGERRYASRKHENLMEKARIH